MPSEAPFDVIHVGAGAEYIPEALFAQLKVGGRMVAMVRTYHPLMIISISSHTYTHLPLLITLLLLLLEQSWVSNPLCHLQDRARGDVEAASGPRALCSAHLEGAPAERLRSESEACHHRDFLSRSRKYNKDRYVVHA
eukprot:GEZU01016400.1.p1 GENE.GEZU01016400.1~~GEZU01016400.1.p1  ORF type:complete len:138 (-),score=2.35 GEZU01016400.1:215-628(-)